MSITVRTLSDRGIGVERHTGGCYAITCDGLVTGYRFHGGDALREAHRLAALDAPAAEIVSTIPRGPRLRSVLPTGSTHHAVRTFPVAHRDMVREAVETLVLKGEPTGARDGRMTAAQARGTFRRADRERDYVRAFTLARSREDRFAYCDPYQREHRECIERMAATPAALVASAATVRQRVAAHRARHAAPQVDPATAELAALRAAAAQAAGGADALTWRDDTRTPHTPAVDMRGGRVA